MTKIKQLKERRKGKMINTDKIALTKKDNTLHFIKINFNCFVKDNLQTMITQLKKWQAKNSTDVFTDKLGLTKNGVIIIECDDYLACANALGIKEKNHIFQNGDSIQVWAKRILGRYLLWLERNLTMQKACSNLMELEHLFNGNYNARLFTAKDYCDWLFNQLKHGVTDKMVFNINLLYLSKLSSQDITKHLLALPNLKQLLANKLFFNLMSMLALEFQRPENSAITPEQKKLMQEFVIANTKPATKQPTNKQDLLEYQIKSQLIATFSECKRTELYAIINCQFEN